MHRRTGRYDVAGLILGGIILLVGGFYFLRNTLGLDIGDLDWDMIWPLAVIVLGAAILVGALERSRRGPTAP